MARLGALFGIWIAVASFSSFPQPCSAEYLSAPSLRWSLQLEGSSGTLSGRGMRKGNALVAHNDGQRVIATADDGSLHIVQTAPQVKTQAVFEPPPVDVNKFTECRSGATIVYPSLSSSLSVEEEEFGTFVPTESSSSTSTNNGLQKEYAVYAVVDATVVSDIQFDESGFVEPADSGDTTSRVMAVNLDGSLKWSVPVEGRIQGDVVVGTTGMYVSHNIGDVGYISVVMTNEDQSSAGVVATLTSSETINGPFTGPALQSSSEGLGDVILVAESWGRGYDETDGGLFMLSPSSNFEDALGRGNDSYELQKISYYSNSAFAPPLVDGDSVFLGAAGANFAAWTGNQRNDLSGISSGRVDEIDPRWVYQMPTNPRNASQPLLNTPVIDSAGEIVCTPGVDNDFYCLSTNNGRSVWTDSTDSEVLVRPLIWEDDSGSVVYSIESRNGRVHQHDLYNGEVYWEYSCADINGLGDLCQASVEAEFSISPSGNIIYYGDVFGRITSIEIADFETDAPTAAPTSLDPPTQRPTEQVVATTAPGDSEGVEEDGETQGGNDNIGDVEAGGNPVSSEQQAQQGEEKDSSNIGIYVGAALGGLCVLLVPIVVFWLMRGKRDKNDDGEMHVEIIDDCDEDDFKGDLESQDVNTSTDESSSDGIEIEYRGSKAVPMTPVKRKKKKRKKSPVQTPQTAATLESIDELPEDTVAASEGEEFEVGIVNLARKFEMAASDSRSAGSSSSSQSSSDENSESSPVSTGDVVVAPGTKHLELAVGNGNNGDMASSDEDEVPPPPPPKATLASSKHQWSWSSLLQMGTSQSSRKNDSTEATNSGSSSNQKVELRPVAKTESKPKEDSQAPLAMSPDPSIDEISRAETPPVNNHAKFPASPESEEFADEEKHLSSPASWPSGNGMSPTPGYSADEESGAEENIRRGGLPSKQERSTQNVEEEKKENEESYGQQISRAAESAYNAISPTMFMAETGDDARSPESPFQRSRALSPNDQSQRSSQIQSPISPERSASVLSNDDSLFTSATGATGEKADDTSNLSPLSTYLFDKDIHRKERSDIPHDEAKAASLSTPDLNRPQNDRFRYLDEDVPDDESMPAPGFQYMKSNNQDDNKAEKYGKSVRSKKDSFRNQISRTNSQGSDCESPITAIYNQLASMGKKQAEEKKQPSFKRRSKRMEREASPDSVPEDPPQETSDTWSNFLQELAEAEEQFFSPKASLLNATESQDSADSEVARINNNL